MRLLPTKEESCRAARLHRSARPDSRTLSPWIPYFSIIRPFFGQDCAECWRLVDLMESRPSPSDDIGRKKETPMNSTPTAIERRDALVARADERFARVHEQIARADEQLARVTEQLAKMDRDTPRPPSAGPGPQLPPRRPALRAVGQMERDAARPPSAGLRPRRAALRALVGLALAACIVVAALVLQSSYGGGAKMDGVHPAPQQLASTPSLRPGDA